jgi:hypothetical protein
MRVYYDTEFYESGARNPVHPISIGAVREDGAEFYAIYRDSPWDCIAGHEWLRHNVLPHLPGRFVGPHFELDWDDPDVKPRRQIRDELSVFLGGPKTELWAYYSSYDHVVLAQTFGTMAEMPKHIPYYTNDIKSLQHLFAPGFRFPEQESIEHKAIDDARWNLVAHTALVRYIELMNGY